MPDIHSAEKRSNNMAAIHSKNTKPEIIVRKYLHRKGYRFRLNVKRLPGSPDIVLRRLHTVILVNGCFWHGHIGCKYYVTPKSNRDFWINKIERNQERDLKVRSELTALGWNVIQIWECQLKPNVRESTLASLLMTLSQIELKLANMQPAVIPYLYNNEDSVRMVADESQLER